MPSLAFNCRWRRWSAVTALSALTACQGVVDPEGAPPGSERFNGGSGASAPARPPAAGAAPAAPGGGGVAAAPTPGAGNGALGGAPSTPPGPTGGVTSGGGTPLGEPLAALAAPFTRLTRAEYLATVEGALGALPDESLIPVDGRVGPYTSNSGVFPDPVHEYLILAEELAAALIPSVLPACEASGALECAREEYAEPLARLYRRPLAEAELAGFAELVTTLGGDGASPDEATRAALGAALISPDFLFRGGGLGGSAHGLAERLSYALWDAPPDAALAGKAEDAAERGESLRPEAERLLGDARAVAVMTRFLAQWLHVDTDLRLEEPSFASSPRYLELVAFVEHALAERVAVTELIAGPIGFVHRDNAAAYGLDELDGSELVRLVTWPEHSPRRGLVTHELFADATRHPDSSRRVIFRGLLVRRSLLCDVIPPPTPELIAAAGEVSDRTVEPRCAGCHQRIDPVGSAFAALDGDAPVTPAELRSHAELEGTYPDLPSLLDAVATSRAFAECFSRHWLSFFFERPLADADPAWVAELADTVQSGASLGDLAEKTIVSLEAGGAGLAPVCEGP